MAAVCCSAVHPGWISWSSCSALNPPSGKHRPTPPRIWACTSSSGGGFSAPEFSSTFNHEASLLETFVSGEARWFPYKDEFQLCQASPAVTSRVVLDSLDDLVDDEQKQRFQKVVANRTYSSCFIAEALDDVGNISAVFRSAEAFGFQSVHVVTAPTVKSYKGIRKVYKGTERWLDVEVWDSTMECIKALKARGYRIAVTSTAQDTVVSICDMDWTIPTAVFFGNEKEGASEHALSVADVQCGIPMNGMVDSLNVSVAAGILMHHAVNDRIARIGIHGDLLLEQQRILTAEFCLRYKRKSSDIFDGLMRRRLLDQYKNF